MTYDQSLNDRARIAYQAWREAMYGWPLRQIAKRERETDAEFYVRLGELRERLRAWDDLESYERSAWRAVVWALDSNESLAHSLAIGSAG